MKLFECYPKLTRTVFTVALISIAGLFATKSCELYDTPDSVEKTESESPEPPPIPPAPDSDVYDVVEQPPEPIGGLESLYSNLSYPKLARQSGIEGKVIVQFVVDENGDVTKPEVIRDIGGGTGDAAIEALESTEWKPGKQDGNKVSVRFQVPIRFQLQDSESGSPDNDTQKTDSEELSLNMQNPLEEMVVTGFGSF